MLGCKMHFVDTAMNKARRFSIGREISSGRYYLSIPVSNHMVDYEEYYEISQEAHDAYPSNEASLGKFADECRANAHDALLLQRSGNNRGVAT